MRDFRKRKNDMNYTTEERHIRTIRGGDTILHKGQLTTVCNCDIKRDHCMGVCIFGDCYKLGTKPVMKATIKGEMP